MPGPIRMKRCRFVHGEDAARRCGTGGELAVLVAEKVSSKLPHQCVRLIFGMTLKAEPVGRLGQGERIHLVVAQ